MLLSSTLLFSTGYYSWDGRPDVGGDVRVHETVVEGGWGTVELPCGHRRPQEDARGS